MKRTRATAITEDGQHAKIVKRRKQSEQQAPNGGSEKAQNTPTKARRGRPLKSALTPTKNRLINGLSADETPTSGSKVRFTSLREPEAVGDGEEIGKEITRNADRSARRKAARAFVQKTLSDDGEDDGLAAELFGSDEEAEDENMVSSCNDADQVPDTPSKRGRDLYRPKKGRQKRASPAPPQDLPPHERYFFDNRPGGQRTSSNTLSSLSLLTHEEYFTILREHEPSHAAELRFLHDLHRRSFPQWTFERSQEFNICLYGYGSKKQLALDYVSYLAHQAEPPKILVVNGYNPNTGIRDIFNMIAGCLPGLGPSVKLGGQPQEMLNTILAHFGNLEGRTDGRVSRSTSFVILVHNIDGPSLRRQQTQSLLARLFSDSRARPHLSCISTVDTIQFPLLWDSKTRGQFRWLFHDCTTFAPWSGVEMDVVESVHALLDKKGSRVGGRDGAMFVLRSLTENARSLYRIILSEQMGLLDGGGVAEAEAWISYGALYQKAVEEFVTSHEQGFRGMLKEFTDHDMVVGKKDGAGAEVLRAPFARGELEGLLEGMV